MPRYTTKREMVDAWQVTDMESAKDIANRVGGSYGTEGEGFEVRIPTLHGTRSAFEGDFVVRDIQTGRYDVMNSDDFHAKYHLPTRGIPTSEERYAQSPALNYDPSSPDVQAEVTNHRNLFEERQRRNKEND